MSELMVTLNNVVKNFDDNVVVKNINMDIKSGEFLTLLGPSGCGKTTTLRMIAGFEQPTDGEVIIDGKEVSNIPPHKRDVNTVFQSYALFPHMNVSDNVAFGLKMKKINKDDIKRRVMEALKLVQLEGFAKRKPDQLSGGQKQRVAIARALVNSPKVLLLDEPLGALDLKLRKQMQVELKHLQQKLGITFIYVTHDQEEALTMSDRIAVMNGGIIEQLGTPDEIYDRPASRFVADFIGETNLFEGKVVGLDEQHAYLDLSGHKVPIIPTTKVSLDEEVSMAIRPERVQLHNELNGAGFAIPGKVVEHIYVGSIIKTVVSLPGGDQVTVNKTPEVAHSFAVDQDVYVNWEPDKAVIIA
ncbi:ABC transporter ATP-binding protein [Siminovitchia terrae]|uniref:Spermidine/putrescine import ATP-binding protein PotA n=1 Tax=Siminovitchia terrae TaxID=1914933 RepID=A0A429X1Y1_SIMTE|nr:ABC transporter ATP-binding protein [Siminovitchia terrae]RST57481.1 ABC transporter ATP-binding protein [Siminovitchia terrae]